MKKAARNLEYCHPTSTPGCADTNGLAEGKVKLGKSGTRGQLIHSGFHKSWWPKAAVVYADNHTFTPSVRWPTDPKESPYERRLKVKFKGMMFALGQLVDFMTTPFPCNTPAPFAERMIPGLFVGYHTQPGGKFNGDYYVIEYSALQANPDMPLNLARKHMHRVKEVKPAITESGRPRFPLGERRNAIKRLPPTLQVVGPNGVQDITLGLGGADDQLDNVDPPVVDDPYQPVQEVIDDDDDPPPQPDTRGQGGWSDAGLWIRQRDGSTRPPHIDQEVWRRWADPVKQEAIAEYLLKISTGTYVPAGPPAAGPTPADIKRGAPAAAVKQSRNQGKKGVYKNPERSAEVHSSIENFRTRLIIMTNDVDYDWHDNICVRQPRKWRVHPVIL